MSCCDDPRCDCIVIAGPGATVDGNGSTTDPYVIGAVGGGGSPTALTVTDSPTVDLTQSGTGTAADPYNITADVIVDPAPPGGGTELLLSGPNGLSLECADVRGCFSAGDGAGYDPDTGIITARPSTDAGNTLGYGTDGGLLVPPAAALTVGCGLAGDGTADTPLTAAPVAGQAAWVDSWDCDAATNSTLKCDPTDGTLWTPPDHRNVADAEYKEHFATGWTPIGVQDWTIVDSGANLQFNLPAGFLSACRLWSHVSTITGIIDASFTAATTFELGYILTIDGGPAITRPLWGRLAAGAAGREKHSGSLHASGYNLAPTAGTVIAAWPAVRVTAGSLTINSWVSDYTIYADTTTA